MEPEIVQGVIKAILEKYADPIFTKIGKAAKREWEKFKIDFDIAFSSYLNKAYDKYSKVKTILYKTEPQFIYDFFEVPFLRVGHSIIKADNIFSVLGVSHFTIIQGNGGIGKSTLLKHLFLSSIDSKVLIPVFLELKDLNEIDTSYELMDFIFQRLEGLDCKLNRDNLDYALQSGRFVFFLDGYDEMYTEKRNAFTKKLESFCDHYPENNYCISSRPFSDFIGLQRFTVINTCPFEKEQAISLIVKINYDLDVKKRFITALTDGLYEKHKSFASNPLLLSIMLLTFENYSEIPEKLHLFYENAFETLYEKHDATKTGFKREIKSKLSYDDFRYVFSYFCFITYAQGVLEFSRDGLKDVLRKINGKKVTFDIEEYIYDLTNALCVVYKDGLNYRFVHRSFQEYFTAFFLKEMSDENMNKASMQLIDKDITRAWNDGVFAMLYDMAGDRFEQNVFLPLLRRFEETGENVDLFDYYFQHLIPGMCFLNSDDFENDPCHQLSPDEKQTVYLALSPPFEPGYGTIIFYLNEIYRRKNCGKYDSQYADKKLYDFLCNDRNFTNGDISCETIIEDDEAYELFKETWIGDLISQVCSLRGALEEKQQKTNHDILSMLEGL